MLKLPRLLNLGAYVHKKCSMGIRILHVFDMEYSMQFKHLCSCYCGNYLGVQDSTKPLKLSKERLEYNCMEHYMYSYVQSCIFMSMYECLTYLHNVHIYYCLIASLFCPYFF